MATNAYLDRMNQLDAKKAETLARKTGLPLQRPLNGQVPGLAGNPQPQQEQDPNEAPDYDTPFGRNIQNFQGEDNRFKEFMQEYTQLAGGLGQMVKQGYMPEVLAKQRLQSYLNDSQKYFSSHAATPMDNPQVAGMIEQALMAASQREGSTPIQDPNAPQGGMPQQAPQGAMPPQGGM